MHGFVAKNVLTLYSNKFKKDMFRVAERLWRSMKAIKRPSVLRQHDGYWTLLLGLLLVGSVVQSEATISINK
jgi:hypothetical protein